MRSAYRVGDAEPILCSRRGFCNVGEVRGLTKWVVWLAVSACGSAQYEARSAADASAPMAHAAPQAPMFDYEQAAAPGMEAPSAADDGAGGFGFGGALPTDLASSGETPTVAQAEHFDSSPTGEGPAMQGGTSAGNEATSTPDAQPPKQLLLIYRAELVLAVFETRATLDKIEQLARTLGGYLVARSDDVIEVRVPVAKFEQALKDASSFGDELSRQVTAEDVGDRYRDLKIRLKNAEVVRERLVALLARATDVKEALLVEEQLGRVTATIEQIKGKLKVLDELIAYSTLTVRLQPHVSHERLEPRVVMPFPWLRELGLSNLLDLEER